MSRSLITPHNFPFSPSQNFSPVPWHCWQWHDRPPLFIRSADVGSPKGPYVLFIGWTKRGHSWQSSGVLSHPDRLEGHHGSLSSHTLNLWVTPLWIVHRLHLHCLCCFAGQGSKVCPQAPYAQLVTHHTSASPADLCAWLENEYWVQWQGMTMNHAVFEQTTAYKVALEHNGCGGQWYEAMPMTSKEHEAQAEIDAFQIKHQWGYITAMERCEGQLLFDYDHEDRPFVQWVRLLYHWFAVLLTDGIWWHAM